VGVCVNRIGTILSSDKDSINKYVRIASDAYTLLAFLSAVPDVQKVTSKLFSDGTIVIDTSALLPIFAERVFSDGKKPFSELFEQAKKVGIELLVTPGVLEEIERHFNLCAAYDRADHWEGRVPYLYQSFILGAKPKGGFRSWSEQFLGSTTPEEDIAEFLREEFGIEVVSIDRHALTRVDDDVRDAVVEFWREAQHRRRSEPGDEIVANRLAEHDIENCLYVLDKRTENKGRSAYGLGVWWLTIDFAASKVASTIEKATGKKIFSPILSLDFLMRNLVFGPRRDHVDLGNTRIFSDTLWDIVPPGLVAIAHEIRTSNVDLPERAIRRKIREELNKQKAQLGPLHLSGLERIEEGLKSMIV